MFMVFNVTFKNISVISWWSVLLVEETGVSLENHQVIAKLSHNVVSSTPRHERDSDSQFLVVIDNNATFKTASEA